MPSNPLTDPNWAPDLADTIERVVGSVRKNTTNHVIKATRFVVFGVIIAIASLAALTLAVIVGTKLSQRLTRIAFRVDYGSSVWLAYVIFGALLVTVGFVLFRFRHAADDE